MEAISLTIIATALITVLIGIAARRKTGSPVENFFVAGRNWPWGLVGLALVAQAIDGNSTLGSTTLGYDFGFWSAAVMPIGLALSLFILGRFFAARLNEMKLFTLADFFRDRYNRSIEIIGAMLMLLSFGILLAGNIASIAILVQNFFPINYESAVIVICLVTLAYCLRSGIISDLYSDIWQVFVLVGGTVAMFIFLISNGYTDGFFQSPAFIDGINLAQMSDVGNGSLVNWATIIALGFGNILAIDFVSRVLSAKSGRAAKRGCYAGGLFTLVLGIPFAVLPLIIHSNGIAAGDAPILLVFASNVLPPLISAAVIGGIIAVSLSTIDGAMLSMGNIVTHNLLRIQDTVRQPRDTEAEKTVLYFSRISLLPIACLAIIFAILLPSPGILLTVAFDIMFASLLAPFVFAFYGKNPNPRAAVYAIIFGFAVRIAFAVLTPTSFGVPNTIFYIENSLIPASWDGAGTILAPVAAFIAYGVAFLFRKRATI